VKATPTEAVQGAAPARSPRLRIGHVEVDALTFAQALDAVEALVRGGRGGFVVTPNVDHVVMADRREDFRAAYADAALSLADGKPIVWSAALLGVPSVEKVSGSDLVPPLMERAAARGWTVWLVGAGPGVAEAAAERLRAGGVRVVGTSSPMVKAVGPDPEGEAAAEAIRASGAQLVLVAFGAPKQELWMHRHRARLAPAVLLGVGATLDFVAGRIRRAPTWISNAGLEWLWRLAREPRRLWRRYLVDDPAFLSILLRTWRERRRPALPPSGAAG
jgi:N-acetylglucosaminyldiphosphoundecaprenol N-acetyl-beta-D-mannosaminyltransferase